MRYSPAKTILYFFISVIILGVILLSLPIARVKDASYSLITILFTSASAVCVTGLTVVDISSYFTIFGQLVILFLIQIGGLGYMTLSTVLGIFIGKISLKERTILKEIMDISSFAGLILLIKKIIKIVLLIEGLGAISLTIFFLKKYNLLKAIYLGIFHSISAFCNAGFSLFPTNYEAYSHSYIFLFINMTLIVTGGLGFLVLVELWNIFKKYEDRISLHSKIVIVTTTFLIFGGAILFLAFEKNNIFQGKELSWSILNSLFQSITARTAGFNTLPINICMPATTLLLCFLMFIGASPGGTGGGIKTSSFAIILSFLYANIRDRESLNLFNRHINTEIINRAFIIAFMAILTIFFSTTLLLIVEKQDILDIIFEVTSAFGTVGLSRGITSSLNDFAKLIIIITMFIGRIGPVTFLMALFAKYKELETIKYPEGKILIG